MEWEDYIGQIVLGDCMDVLRQIPDGAVDVMVKYELRSKMKLPRVM